MDAVGRMLLAITPIRRFAVWVFAQDEGASLIALSSLIYTGFLFMPAIVGVPSEIWLWPTLCSLALFLPLYVLCWRGRTQVRWLAIAAIAALGFALQPASLTANTYIIYAAAAAGVMRPLSIAATAIAAILIGYSAWVLFLGQPWLVLVVVWIVSVAVASGNALAQANRLKEAKLRLSQEEVQHLARLAERERIGRDLHDLLGHTLSVVVLKSELAARLFDRDPAAARREIQDVERIARDTLGQVRRAVTGIRAAGLRAELANARLALEAADIQLHYEASNAALDPQLETVLALGLREAVTNVIRHAGATRVEVRLGVDTSGAWLDVMDDGRGGTLQPGSGLRGMRERLQGLGGTLDIVDRKPGLHLRMRLPASGSHHAAATAANLPTTS